MLFVFNFQLCTDFLRMFTILLKTKKFSTLLQGNTYYLVHKIKVIELNPELSNLCQD
jgi:hypothetical protein